MKYYIGVDGGGTKTAFALFDENKNGFEEKRKIYLFLFLIFPDKLGKFESIIKIISLFVFLF